MKCAANLSCKYLINTSVFITLLHEHFLMKIFSKDCDLYNSTFVFLGRLVTHHYMISLRLEDIIPKSR